MTELEAINQMLISVGEDYVSDLNIPVYEAQLALSFLRQVSREVQSKGWVFNQDIRYPLAPDAQGFIVVSPDQILRVDVIHDSRDITVRQNKLYNRDAFTFVFDKPVSVDITRFLQYEDLPFVAQSYIYMKAARRFQKKILGSDSLDAMSAQDEFEALAELTRYDTQDGNYNMLNNEIGQRLYKGRRR